MNLDLIISEVREEFSPHAWDRVILKIVPELQKRGLKIHKFRGNIEVDSDLVSLIN